MVPAVSAVMSFILDSNEDTRGIVVAAFKQKNYLRIKEGQYAEVALFGYPGEIFTGRVLNTIDISGVGQLSASGILPDIWAVPPRPNLLSKSNSIAVMICGFPGAHRLRSQSIRMTYKSQEFR